MNSAKFWLLVGGLMGSLAVTFGAFGAHWIEQKIPEWYTTDDVVVEGAELRDQTKEVYAAAVQAGLKDLHAKKLKTWMTGVRYHFYHTFAIIVVGTLFFHIETKSKILDAAAVCFCLGIGLFSGSIYTLVISKISIFGMFAAVGGVFQLTGWMLFVVGIWKAEFFNSSLNKGR